jgi:hypothetical protein
MKKLLFLSAFLYALSARAQMTSTDGIIQVQQIESKAAAYAGYVNTLDKLNGQLSSLQNAQAQKLQQLLAELEAMKKQRDAEIVDLKMGYFCSQCGVMKTDMEKKGENFEDHLRRVNGVPVPAGDSRIAEVRKAWTEKIALKTVQINNFKAKEDPAIPAKKAEIETLKKLMDKICPEIYALSQTYEQRVVAQGKTLQSAWIDPAMSAAAAEHIAQDKVFLAQARITETEKEFQQKSNDTRERIKNDTEEKKKILNNEIQSHKNMIASYEQEWEEQSEQVKTALDPKKQRHNELIGQLKMKITDSLRKVYTTESNTLLGEIKSLEQKLQALQKSYTDKTKQREALIKKRDEEIWQLTTGLSKRQEDEVALLKKQYDLVLNDLKQKKSAYQQALPAAHTNFLALADDARKKIVMFTNVIEAENRRMYAAASPIKCQVLTAAQLTVSRNFNEEASCMDGLRSKDRSYPGTGMGCTAKSTAYMNVYKPFVSGLNAKELSVIRANTGVFWSGNVL